MFKGSSLKKNAKFYTTVFLAGLVFLTTLTSVGFAALNQNLNIAGQLEYEKHEVWAENLSYDNTNTGVNCDTAQCMLDCLADESLCPIDFATASWDDIVNASPSQLQASMNNGTTRSIDLGDLGTHQLRIVNISTPSECSENGFSQTACGLVIEFADIITTHRMNPYTNGKTDGDGNKGGWLASEMRTYVNSNIYNALPSDLRSKIINTTVVSSHGSKDSSNFTSTDKMYLLSTHEIYEEVDGNTGERIDYYDRTYNSTRQLDYYSSKNVKTKSSYAGAIKQNSGTNAVWSLRSAYLTDDYKFFCVMANGEFASGSSGGARGVSPAFRIG